MTFLRYIWAYKTKLTFQKDLLCSPSTQRAQDVLRLVEKQARRLYYGQFAVNTCKMSVALSQPDNKALKDKQKWWRKQICNCELLHHHPLFMASVLQSSVSLTNCADCQGPPRWTSPPPSVFSSNWITLMGKDLRKRIKIQIFSQFLFYYFMDKTVSQIFIYRCTWIFPACLAYLQLAQRFSSGSV